MHEREVGDEKDRRIREMEKESAELARANEIFQEMLGFSQRTERRKARLRYDFVEENSEQ